MQNGIDSFVKRAISYLAEQNNWTIIAMETDKDHIHILLEYDTTERICDIISIIKQRTTHWLWIRYRDVLSKYLSEEDATAYYGYVFDSNAKTCLNRVANDADKTAGMTKILQYVADYYGVEWAPEA